MASVKNTSLFIVIPLLSIINMVNSQAVNLKPQFLAMNAKLCKNLAKEPYFDLDVIVGKPWRVYYSWNMRMENTCLDMVFKNSTPMMVQRIWNDMSDYLETQPAWNAATMHLSMGTAAHELLFFADQGPEGSFVAIPNVARDGNITPTKGEVPLLKFQFKLLREGSFLLMTDCKVGVSTLSARTDRIPYPTEILAATSNIDLGDGFPACISDKPKRNRYPVK